MNNSECGTLQILEVTWKLIFHDSEVLTQFRINQYKFYKKSEEIIPELIEKKHSVRKI